MKKLQTGINIAVFKHKQGAKKIFLTYLLKKTTDYICFY